MWSYLLSAIGVFGLYVAGRKKWWGWLINLGSQGLWVAFAIATAQYGFIIGAVAYGWVYGRNAWRWFQEKRKTTVGKSQYTSTMVVRIPEGVSASEINDLVAGQLYGLPHPSTIPDTRRYL